MKIKNVIFVLAVLIGLSACSGKLKVIPEISSALSENIVFEFKRGEDTASKILVDNSELVIISLTGNIRRLNPKAKMVTFLYNLTFNVEPQIIHNDNVIVLKKKDTDFYVVFDIRQMKVVKALEKLNSKKLLYVDKSILVYSTEKELIFYRYTTNQLLKKTSIPTGTEFLESQWEHADPRIVLFTTDHLYVFNTINGGLESIPLKRKATSGFLADGGDLYYGTQDRYLVRWSMNSGKIKWQFKLPERLETKPMKAGPFISIVPADNNIYFFNKRGTLKWWDKLNSIRSHPPVLMEENAAVFLWDKSFKFFDYDKERTVSLPYGLPLHTPPVHLDGYLYAVSQVDLETDAESLSPRILVKFGNNYNVEINTDPEHIIPRGRSVEFQLLPFNLIEPSYAVRIVDPAEKTVFKTTLPYRQDPSFVWIPDQALTYKMIIEINSQNQKGLIVEKNFDVVDVEKRLREYYYILQKRVSSELKDRATIISHHP